MRWLIVFCLAGIIIILAIRAYSFVAWGNDWELAFAPAGQAALVGRNPYEAAPFYASPPWGLFVIAPLSFIHPALAMLLPALALFSLAYSKRKPMLIPLVGLSAPFLMCTVYANIDWLVMVGVAIGGPVGVVLDTLKPQAGVAVIGAELASRDTWRERLGLLLLVGGLALLTAPLWLSWLHSMTAVGGHQERSITSLYPRWVGLLIALPALWLTFRQQSKIAGCIASIALAPYVQLMSLLPLTFLVAEADWRWGLALDVALWVFAALVFVRIIPLVF